MDMFFYFNKKRLLMDNDPTELARVKLILDNNGIRYGVKTTLSDNAMSRSFNAAAAQRYVTKYSDASNQTYLYQLFVRHKDYKKAKRLCF